MIPLLGSALLSILLAKAQGIKYIETVNDLIDLSEAVHKGQSFSGETIILTSDIDLNSTDRTFYPIGRCLTRDVSGCTSFNGIFNGQGHVIRNIQIISYEDIVLGLFGYSTGMTVNDVILDSTNNFTLTAGSAGIYGATFSYVVGGVVGACSSRDSECYVNRCVSMASIVASGNMMGKGNVIAGSVAGVLRPYFNFDCSVRDCVANGQIFLSVSNANESRVGGIVGLCKGMPEEEGNGTCSVRNCIQYGTIIHTEIGGTTPYNVGDIVGEIKEQTVIQNCVSMGTFSFLQSFLYNNMGNYGAIAGDVTGGNPDVRECYWSRSAPVSGPIGRGGAKVNMTNTVSFDNNKELFAPVLGTTSLVEALNKGRDLIEDEMGIDTDPENSNENENNNKLGKWSRFMFYTDGGGTYIPMISLNVHLEHYLELPAPIKSSSHFNYWYTDIPKKTPFDVKQLNDNFFGDVVLYAMYDVVIGDIKTFFQIATSVSNGNTFFGTTVYLTNDIDLSMLNGSSFDPIGRYVVAGEYFPFNGVFDGQGHVISHLSMVSNDAAVGLFGYSTGTSILNVVLDSTCNITSTCTLNTYDSSTSALLSTCFASDAPCIINGCISAASVRTMGDVERRQTYLGGIGGLFRSKGRSVIIKNTAVISGAELRYEGSCFSIRIGGIIAAISGESLGLSKVENCFFEGKIDALPGMLMAASPVEPPKVSVGGIAGTIDTGGVIDNCAVNMLKLQSKNISEINNESESIYGCICGEAKGVLNVETRLNNSFCTLLSPEINVPTVPGDIPLIGRIISPEYIKIGNIEYYNTTTGMILGSNTPVSKPLNTFRGNNSLKWSLVIIDPMEGTFDRTQRLFLGKNPGRYAYIPETFPPPGFVFGGWFAEKELLTPVTIDTLVESCDDVIYAYSKYLQSVIETPQDFLHFANAVNSGFNYFNKTILLGSDIDLSNFSFAPIGNNKTHSFRGIFDGQGHIIDGISISGKSSAVGLFGYSTGAKVKNLVLGPSCSISSVALEERTKIEGSESVVAIGGIFGFCVGRNSPCVIESCVTMGEVVYSEKTLHLSEEIVAHVGGLAGSFHADRESVNVVNCGVYGNVSYHGITSEVHVGGVIGGCGGNGQYEFCMIENSLFRGNMHCFQNDISGVIVGGIAGIMHSNGLILNCVAFPYINKFIDGFGNLYGSITGTFDGSSQSSQLSTSRSSEISNCYWLPTMTSSGEKGEEEGSEGEEGDAGAGALGKKVGSFDLSYVLPFSSDFYFDERIVSGGVSTKSLITALNSHVASTSVKWILFSYLKNSPKQKNSEKMFDDKLVLRMHMEKVDCFVAPELPPLGNNEKAKFLGWYEESSNSPNGERLVNFTALEPGRVVMYPKWKASNGADTISHLNKIAVVFVALFTILWIN